MLKTKSKWGNGPSTKARSIARFLYFLLVVMNILQVFDAEILNACNKYHTDYPHINLNDVIITEHFKKLCVRIGVLDFIKDILHVYNVRFIIKQTSAYKYKFMIQILFLIGDSSLTRELTGKVNGNKFHTEHPLNRMAISLCDSD